jgi:hypothetical protein
LRSAVDQIADGNNPVGGGVETYFRHRAFEKVKAAMNIADDKIAALGIFRQF